MAVTYAWRLDSNKYAYILPPYDLKACTGPKTENNPEAKYSLEYGFLSNTPLTDYFLRAVGTAAEDKFGKNSEGGLALYQTAFDAMLAKISGAANGALTQIGENEITTISDWKGMDNAVILSADVYFNVDSENCADLRGVGIKGARYLGSIPGSTYINDKSVGETSGKDLAVGLDYLASGTPTTVDVMLSDGTVTDKDIIVQAGIPGFTDVYGIYLEDNLEDEDTVSGTTQTPEYMFVIRNGKDGARGEEGPAYQITDGVKEGLAKQEDLKTLSGTVTTLKTDVEKIGDNLETLTQYYNTISLDNINNLITMVTNLQRQLNRLEEYLFGFELPDVTNDGDDPTIIGGGTGRIQIVPLGMVKKSKDDSTIAQDDYTYNGDKATGAGIEGWDTADEEILKVNNKKFHLLGYLEPENDYLVADEKSQGVRAMPSITRLYSLPNIAVTLTGITFGVKSDYDMNVRVNGSGEITGSLKVGANMQADKISANHSSITGTSYASGGFYQTESTENVSAKTITTYTDFSKDPTIE